MGDPALRDDSIDDDEFFSPTAFKPRAVDDEFNAESAFKKPEPAHEPDFVRYQAPEARAADTRGVLERFLDGDGILETPKGPQIPYAKELRDAYDTAGDAASGLAGGITGHLDQRLPFGIGDAIRDDRAQARARSPIAETGGEIAGVVGSPLGKVARAEGLLGNAAAQAVNAGVQGTARRIGDQTDDNTDVLKALVDSEDDAKLGGLVGGGAHALGTIAKGAANAAGTGANYLRRIAFGVQPGDVADEMSARGTGEGLRYAKDELSKLPEKLGLSKWYQPQSTTDYAVGAERLRKEGGALKGSALDRADRVVPPEHIDAAKDDILERFAGEQAAADAAYSSNHTAPEYRDLTQRLQDAVPSTPRDLDNMKQTYEGSSYALKTAPQMERGAAAANKVAADEARMRLGGVMAGANRVDPGILEDFTKGSQQFGDAATVEKIARSAAAKSAVAPMIGGALGGVAGYQTQHDLKGAGLGAAAGALATRGLQTYGADMGANALRGVEGLSGGASQALQSAAQSGGRLAEAKQVMAQSRGQELPNVINKLLADPQGAQSLGKYRAEFESAGRTPGGIAGLLSKLQRDREWRETYLPKLQRMTAGDQQ
jgi:hypothetical protein